MKSSDYILINKKVLPDHFTKVLAVKELVSKGENTSTACKKVGLSRSAYYKYKDDVFPANKVDRRLVVVVKLSYSPRVLIELLDELSKINIKIFALNQEIPVNNVLFVTMTLALSEQVKTSRDLIEYLSKLEYVNRAKLLGIE